MIRDSRMRGSSSRACAPVTGRKMVRNIIFIVFEFQPDLNFRNPVVLLEMAGHLLYWLEIGVDGFRADAIPYIWKEEGTACENLPRLIRSSAF